MIVKYKSTLLTLAVFMIFLTAGSLISFNNAFGLTGEGDPLVLTKMQQINAQLAAKGLNYYVEQMEFFTLSGSRPINRIHQQPFQWVPGDPRRLADGNNITYLVNESRGITASGLSNSQTEAAIDRAFDTWQADNGLKKVNLVKRAYSGADPDIIDFFYGFGQFGNPFLADIVNAGWLPGAFFDAIVPGGSQSILSVSISLIFVHNGVPTDIDRNKYLDTALNEVYYNDNFGDPNGTMVGNPWGINVVLPGIDVETAALHENGHSLGLGHFGPPPDAVMNIVYGGLRQSLFAIDGAGLCAVWSSWPQ